ncbi:MAG TPA: hypothetical protein VHP32_08315 [Ignavibacteria bacterium]|nr:hypothetical protein [Ignavibacteria bacterium]
MSELYLKKVEDDAYKKKFIDFPYQLYRGNDYWVPPLRFDVKNNLDTVKNPFYQHAKIAMWLAYKDGEIAGRIAAITNESHNKFYNDKVGFFGFFECINDVQVSRMLFDEASKWLKEQGKDVMRGPVNPSMNDECGLLINAFDQSNVLLMPYNFEYYIKLLEDFGFHKAKDLYAFWISKDVIKNEKMMAKLDRVANMIIKKENIKIRNVNMKDFKNEVQKVREVYNNAWSANWGFVPMTEAEFNFVAANMKLAVDPDYVEFAEINGKPVGFTLVLPDLNQATKGINGKLFPFGIFKFLAAKKKINRVRVIIMGVIKEYQKKGIDAIFYRDTIVMGNKKNVTGAEISWVLEDNMPMVQSAVNLGAEIYKTYRIYDKSL